MQSPDKTTPLNLQWQDLQQLKPPDANQLENIKPHLDLVLLALEAIASVNSEDLLQAAQELNLVSMVEDRLKLWWLPPADNQRQNRSEAKKLEIEEVRSLVLIICHLAKQHQELIRRGVSLLEQISEQSKESDYPVLLTDYLAKFIKFSQQKTQQPGDLTAQSLSQLAFKLLIDLLFYSGDNGHQLLWLAIFATAN